MATKKIAIIGGGVSGIMAGITARRLGADVTIFEHNTRVGKKLLSTGNGRCNITNQNILERDSDGGLLHYYGENKHFADFALETFTNNDLLNFFGELGVLFRCENDKYYPYSETASTILDVIRLYCEKLGVKSETEKDVKEITEKNGKFSIFEESFDKVIIASGGASSPHLGTDGSGYSLLSKFNHKRTKLSPAITQIRTDNKYTKQLKGIKCNANATVLCGKKTLRKEYGQILFTDYGLSGPPIFQLSSCFEEGAQDMSIELDFMPEYSFTEICDNLLKIKGNGFMKNFTAESFLIPMLSRKLGQIIIKYCNIPLTAKVNSLSQGDLKKITDSLKHFRLKVYGTKGFANAQVTAGGMLVSEFKNDTMESKLKKGLYACGEVLDITGDCGGYNLQWAFSSGYIAGRSAASD